MLIVNELGYEVRLEVALETNKNVQNYLHFALIKSMFIVFVNKTIDFPDPAAHIGRFKCWNLPKQQCTLL